MVAIRLRRAGSKKRPFFRVVVTDSRTARDSSFVEILGHYNPRSRPAVVQVNKERLDQWVKNGAQMSSSVRTLVARHLTPAAAPAPAAAAVSASADTLVMARPTEQS
jgi:small subunit ribosomal protein S16